MGIKGVIQWFEDVFSGLIHFSIVRSKAVLPTQHFEKSYLTSFETKIVYFATKIVNFATKIDNFETKIINFKTKMINFKTKLSFLDKSS